MKNSFVCYCNCSIEFYTSKLEVLMKINIFSLKFSELVENLGLGIIHILCRIVWGGWGSRAQRNHHRVNITKQRNIWGVEVQQTSILMLHNI
jgi:hypothetical protein